MYRYTNFNKIELIKIYYRNNDNASEAARIFNENNPDGPQPSYKTVQRFVDKFNLTGSVENIKPPGRPISATNEQNKANVKEIVEANPTKSIPEITALLGLHISKSSVYKMIKSLKFHPYKYRMVQELNEDDYDRR